MALQGDLKSFALPDVLRLLAGTGKSGHLEVSAAGGTGELVLAAGTIASAAVSTSPHATEPSDVVYELLRFEDGSFAFDEVDVPDAGAAADVDTTIGLAESLILEWAEVEAVVPSMAAWVSFTPAIDDDVAVTPGTWAALVAIAGGGTVTDLADSLELSDLAACRQVKALVESGLVDVRASHSYTAPVEAPRVETYGGYEPPMVELDDFEQYERAADEMTGPSDGFDDLDELGSDERPVVMEEREDALLPEPLPGEGVAYAGETITGMVDGRAFDAPEADAPETEQFAAFESLASFEAEAAMSDLAGEPGTIDSFGSVEDFAAFAADEDAFQPEADLAEQSEASVSGIPSDDERGSLLKFLSSVKP